ncbi:unnamed protein product [Bursaphelenchus xylophilus]|uniref:(pine wood nematode) hypothetical protein n=1 Tax=Bursaphelenchus xylophilus TaxID=6326 RepID=A0A7I8XGV5_BURXY|nr:unnamed protein product [Bursaphelenchus xylophilus]CAG9082192.1 unnamed protein product [Bursaphelenchus xylophilus]
MRVLAILFLFVAGLCSADLYGDIIENAVMEMLKTGEKTWEEIHDKGKEVGTKIAETNREIMEEMLEKVKQLQREKLVIDAIQEYEDLMTEIARQLVAAAANLESLYNHPKLVNEWIRSGLDDLIDRAKSAAEIIPKLPPKKI